MPARAVPYHFSISITGGFTFGQWFHFRTYCMYTHNIWHLKG